MMQQSVKPEKSIIKRKKTGEQILFARMFQWLLSEKMDGSKNWLLNTWAENAHIAGMTITVPQCNFTMRL